jgi:3-methyladenine DNA glycosylase AlkD
MNVKQAMAALRAAGTAQNRKIYGRHGVTRDMFGVSYAVQGRLKKQIGTDHELARALWATGNHDARVLATMVADPADMGSRELDAWARELDSYVVADVFGGLVSKSPHALRKVDAWRDRRAEHVAACAFNVLASLAVDEDRDLDEDWLLAQLAVIRAEIHDRPNRTRHSMNQALIAIGTRGDRLQKAALAAAKAIGKVTVDHGETSCQTPDAAAYIAKTLAHRAGKKKARP